jgi:hypothetical protein
MSRSRLGATDLPATLFGHLGQKGGAHVEQLLLAGGESLLVHGKRSFLFTNSSCVTACARSLMKVKVTWFGQAGGSRQV